MIWVYAVLLLIILIFSIKCSRQRKEQFSGCRSKEHPFRFFYPLASVIVDKLHKRKNSKNDKVIVNMLKSIYVRENVEKEQYIYLVKKTASVIAALSAVLILGFLVCTTESQRHQINNIERADNGSGVSTYQLEADYRNEKEDIEVAVDEVKLTRSEIMDLFERSRDEVLELMLGDNESQDNVADPVNLVTEYKGFSIYWEIDDLSAMDYNGEIKAELDEKETLLVNLTATFSLEDVSEQYMYPLCLTGKELTSSEKLLEQIKKDIEENNDKYSREVSLPDEIDGYDIKFFSIKAGSGAVFMIIAVLAVCAVLLLYDRALTEKVKKRQEELLSDYPEIISRLSLLYGAGLSMHGAFERILDEKDMKAKKDHYVYKEIKLALEKIKSGVSEGEAYSQFGKRCGLHSYIKLGNLLEQNLHKGTKGLSLLLSQEAAASFEERKRNARKKGEQLGTKMLIPMVMMLVVSIAIIAVPALMSMNF